jgi:hypothetical protein
MTNQNKAPGPPITIARGTPAILPLPRLVDIAVNKACKGDIVFFVELFNCCDEIISKNLRPLRNCGKYRNIDKKMPTHKNRPLKSISMELL